MVFRLGLPGRNIPHRSLDVYRHSEWKLNHDLAGNPTSVPRGYPQSSWSIWKGVALSEPKHHPAMVRLGGTPWRKSHHLHCPRCSDCGQLHPFLRPRCSFWLVAQQSHSLNEIRRQWGSAKITLMFKRWIIKLNGLPLYFTGGGSRLQGLLGKWGSALISEHYALVYQRR